MSGQHTQALPSLEGVSEETKLLDELQIVTQARDHKQAVREALDAIYGIKALGRYLDGGGDFQIKQSDEIADQLLIRELCDMTGRTRCVEALSIAITVFRKAQEFAGSQWVHSSCHCSGFGCA